MLIKKTNKIDCGQRERERERKVYKTGTDSFKVIHLQIETS